MYADVRAYCSHVKMYNCERTGLLSSHPRLFIHLSEKMLLKRKKIKKQGLKFNPGVSANRPSNNWAWLPVGLLAQLVSIEQCTGIAEDTVRIPASLNFFRFSFRNCISCDLNCEDLPYIYFFTPGLNYLNIPHSTSLVQDKNAINIIPRGKIMRGNCFKELNYS